MIAPTGCLYRLALMDAPWQLHIRRVLGGVYSCLYPGLHFSHPYGWRYCPPTSPNDRLLLLPMHNSSIYSRLYHGLHFSHPYGWRHCPPTSPMTGYSFPCIIPLFVLASTMACISPTPMGDVTAPLHPPMTGYSSFPCIIPLFILASTMACISPTPMGDVTAPPPHIPQWQVPMHNSSIYSCLHHGLHFSHLYGWCHCPLHPPSMTGCSSFPCIIPLFNPVGPTYRDLCSAWQWIISASSVVLLKEGEWFLSCHI